MGYLVKWARTYVGPPPILGLPSRQLLNHRFSSSLLHIHSHCTLCIVDYGEGKGRVLVPVGYCRPDSAYLCVACDAANRVAIRHGLVWVFETCERAPAAFTCKAEAASLCAACDADIHSANPLTRRHHRVPVLPVASPSAGPHPGVIDINVDCMVEEEDADADAGVDVDDEEADSWLLLSQAKNGENHEGGNGYLYDQREVNEYLDLVEYNSTAEEQYNQQQQQCKDEQYGASGEGKKMMMSSDGSDSVVPVQCSGGNELHR